MMETHTVHLFSGSSSMIPSEAKNTVALVEGVDENVVVVTGTEFDCTVTNEIDNLTSIMAELTGSEKPRRLHI